MSESRSDRADTEMGRLTAEPQIADNSQLESRRMAMDWIGFEDKKVPGDFRVEAIDNENEGVVYVAIFSGPDAKDRAMEYADIKNAQEARLSRIAS